MLKSNHYKTIVISDLHLGIENSRAKEVSRFLRTNTCDLLILNGDIVDGWQLKKSGKWKKRHSRFIKSVIDMPSTHNTRVIYIKGNHDDFLDHFVPFTFGKISILRDYIHLSGNKRYYVTHGDIFDTITTNFRWLASLGSIGYTMLLWLNKIYNNQRLRKGLPYHSLSKIIKYKVKTAVSYISGFEKELVKIARVKKCDGVICGHIHTPAIAKYDNITYMNSGDWVESLSALVEDYFGNWKIIYYSDLVEEERRATMNGQTQSSAVKINAVNSAIKPTEFKPVKLRQVKSETIV
ncbi:MAG: UDP-2,3-diacylglucosamine diphosphatase [Bacteroidales bacterium]